MVRQNVFLRLRQKGFKAREKKDAKDIRVHHFPQVILSPPHSVNNKRSSSFLFQAGFLYKQ